MPPSASNSATVTGDKLLPIAPNSTVPSGTLNDLQTGEMEKQRNSMSTDIGEWPKDIDNEAREYWISKAAVKVSTLIAT